jgi:two-component system phosphate regulon sensor histidine kinase PhoR
VSITFRAKLFASHLGLVAVVVLVAIVTLHESLGDDLRSRLDQRLEQQARGAAAWMVTTRHREKLATRLGAVVNARVTIISPDGDVVGDSSYPGEAQPSIVNQSDAAEFIAARAGGVGRATHAAEGDGTPMQFVAVPTGDGLVLRLGMPLTEIQATLAAMRERLLFASLLASLAALALGALAARVIARPLRVMTESAARIAQGDYDIAVGSDSPDDVGILSRALASLAAQLKARIGDLTAERDRLSAILSGMVEGVLVVGPDRRVLQANPSAERILGQSEPAAGRSLADAVRHPGARELIEESIESGRVLEAELDAREGAADGADRSLAINVRPLAAANDEGSGRDAAERTSGRDAAERTSGRDAAPPKSRRGVAERSSPKPPAGGGVVAVLHDLTRLRRLETIRRDFLANLSHELRTPVTAIQGYSETLLRGTADPATQREFLEIIHRNSTRLGRLVADLLRISNLEARPPDPAAREPVHLAGVAEHVTKTVRDRAKAAGITLQVDVAADLRALADPDGLEQVIENLVDNAIKYGAGEVTIRGRAASAGRVTLTVEDKGNGIAAHHLPRLFERFYRVDESRSRERGGVGLGLAIVKHLVESMGGTVSVDSEVGRGTRFTVELGEVASGERD